MYIHHYSIRTFGLFSRQELGRRLICIHAIFENKKLKNKIIKLYFIVQQLIESVTNISHYIENPYLVQAPAFSKNMNLKFHIDRCQILLQTFSHFMDLLEIPNVFEIII